VIRTGWSAEAAEARLASKQGDHRLLREVVTAEEIAAIVSRWTGIPVTRLQEGERGKLLRIDEVLRARCGPGRGGPAGCRPIWRRQCHLSEEHISAAEVGIFASGFAAVEAELVIRLGQDLPAHDRGGWTAQEAADLEQHLLVGVEVASSPIPDINSLGPTVIAADFGNNNGLALGSVLADRPGGAPVQLACYVDGQLMGEGSAENLPGGIHHGLATALNILASRGQPVRAGMVFATGAITGIHPIVPGQHCRVEMRGGPSVELRTADARTLLRS
jgi:hypothetical protein